VRRPQPPSPSATHARPILARAPPGEALEARAEIVGISVADRLCDLVDAQVAVGPELLRSADAQLREIVGEGAAEGVFQEKADVARADVEAQGQPSKGYPVGKMGAYEVANLLDQLLVPPALVPPHVEPDRLEELNKPVAGLRLSEAEREYLFILAQNRPPEIVLRETETMDSGLQHILDSLKLSPAAIRTSAWDVLAANDAFCRRATRAETCDLYPRKPPGQVQGETVVGRVKGRTHLTAT